MIAAKVIPAKDTIAFVDDGSTPFENEGGECRVRMQRVGPWLMVEDKEGCCGAAVTFTGALSAGEVAGKAAKS